MKLRIVSRYVRRFASAAGCGDARSCLRPGCLIGVLISFGCWTIGVGSHGNEDETVKVRIIIDASSLTDINAV